MREGLLSRPALTARPARERARGESKNRMFVIRRPSIWPPLQVMPGLQSLQLPFLRMVLHVARAAPETAATTVLAVVHFACKHALIAERPKDIRSP